MRDSRVTHHSYDPETHDPLTHGHGLINVYRKKISERINTELRTQINTDCTYGVVLKKTVVKATTEQYQSMEVCTEIRVLCQWVSGPVTVTHDPLTH